MRSIHASQSIEHGQTDKKATVAGQPIQDAGPAPEALDSQTDTAAAAETEADGTDVDPTMPDAPANLSNSLGVLPSPPQHFPNAPAGYPLGGGDEGSANRAPEPNDGDSAGAGTLDQQRQTQTAMSTEYSHFETGFANDDTLMLPATTASRSVIVTNAGYLAQSARENRDALSNALTLVSPKPTSEPGPSAGAADGRPSAANPQIQHSAWDPASGPPLEEVVNVDHPTKAAPTTADVETYTPLTPSAPSGPNQQEALGLHTPRPLIPTGTQNMNLLHPVAALHTVQPDDLIAAPVDIDTDRARAHSVSAGQPRDSDAINWANATRPSPEPLARAPNDLAATWLRREAQPAPAASPIYRSSAQRNSDQNASSDALDRKADGILLSEPVFASSVSEAESATGDFSGSIHRHTASFIDAHSPIGAPYAPHSPSAMPPARQLAEAIIRSSTASGQTELVLTPEELGKVQFSIRNIDGQLTVLILAERPETMALLRRNADLLAAELSQSGMGGAELNFGGDHQGGGKHSGSPRGVSAQLGQIPDVQASLAPPERDVGTMRNAITGGRLNIRL